MPVATKSLHVANSFEELMKLVDGDAINLKDKHFRGKNLRMLCISTSKVLEAADLHKNDGDEERSFFLYMRYFSMVDYIRKHKDYKMAKDTYDKLLKLEQCIRVMDTLEEQKKSLQKRYAILKDAKEAEAKERKAEEAAAELMRKPAPPPQPPEPTSNQLPSNGSDSSVTKLPADVIKPPVTQLSSFKLLDMLQDKDTNVLIMDARPRQDFLDSHLKSSDCINIPEEVLKPGIIAEELSRSIPEESVELFEKRDVVDFVVLMDWRSADVPEDNQAPLKVLKDAIYKWSTQKVLRCEPMVLKDGYEDWLMRYPMHTTNAHTKVPETNSDPLVSNYLNSTDTVYFPDPDNLFEEAVRSMAQQAKPSGPASNPVTATMPLVDRSKKPSLSNGPLPNSVGPKMANGSSVNVPDSIGTKGGVFLQADLASKPLPGGPFRGLSQDSDSGESEATSLEGIRQTENLKQKLLDLTKDQLASEKEFELLRERKAREAEEELRRSVQEREEALQAHIRQLEKERAKVEQKVTDLTRSNEQYEQKLKEKDKELVRIIQLNEEQRRADKEVHKLREERKRKEQQEREEVQKDSGKTVADKAAVPSPPRTLKPATNAAANSNNLKSQGTNAATPAERPQGVPMRSNNNLSRSRSFPNLSTAAEESTSESTGPATSAAVPQFDRTLKPSQSVETSTVVISRQPRARTGDVFYPRVRSISPSSGQEFKRSAGLRNLGNTCYMNATLQCLANTIPLALHFLSDRYKRDINRDSHRSTGGETAHEFKSLLAQMYYNDKSVSPKGFKCLMGKLFNVYAGYEQQDAHEFLLNFIDKLHEDLNRALHRKGAPAPLPPADEANLSLNGRINRFWCQHLDRHLSVVSDLFEGLLVSNLTCLACRKSSSSFEVFSCLSLPIPAVSGSVCYLQDCLKLFLETESMSGEAAWDCPTCKQKRRAEKRMIIARLPKILIVQFNRFRCETAWQSKKLQTYVHFPVNSFDMNSYVDHTRVDTQRRPPYHLYAFLNHYGTLATGHYIAYCRAGLGGQWYMYDDASVTEVTLSESDKRNAYILFYTSVDMRHQFTSHS
ncbi:ubiquitin carboxyl-terminal hydrolase 8-like [Dermacentor albipictus]|uniref:ubiquitin carboxyl-terminal hydrolase 8-like n=1 Tax=Dermacentor albipictus TaxID=60249 RepID=UPI0031FC84B7